tara:strand:- start:549 stop:719 length:171 start_codon:yes stop_codon:yes gene_type:complete
MIFLLSPKRLREKSRKSFLQEEWLELPLCLEDAIPIKNNKPYFEHLIKKLYCKDTR